MNTTWLIAKYMPDIRRREPMNVGVVLLANGGPCARFLGETDPGLINGHLVRGRFGALENYKGWVDYWRMAMAKADPKQLLRHEPQHNYFLEFGGERVLGNADLDRGAFLDRLYRDLVENVPSVPDVVVDPRRLIERTFDRLKIREKILERPSVVDRTRGVEDPLAFDYRYQNGINVLMKRVHLAKEPWATVHETAWIFGQARTTEPDTRLIPLLSHVPGVDPGAPMKLLKGIGGYDAVDVSDEATAANGLVTALGLTPISVTP